MTFIYLQRRIHREERARQGAKGTRRVSNASRFSEALAPRLLNGFRDRPACQPDSPRHRLAQATAMTLDEASLDASAPRAAAAARDAADGPAIREYRGHGQYKRPGGTRIGTFWLLDRGRGATLSTWRGKRAVGAFRHRTNGRTAKDERRRPALANVDGLLGVMRDPGHRYGGGRPDTRVLTGN